MNRAVCSIALALASAPAWASIDLSFDSSIVNVTRPSSGTVFALFRGTVDVATGFDVSAYSLAAPVRMNTDSPSLEPFLETEFWLYGLASNPGLDYEGPILRIEVLAATPYGLYAYTTSGNLARLELEASGPGGAFAIDREAFGVNVVPEPGIFAALAIGWMTLGWFGRRGRDVQP